MPYMAEKAFIKQNASLTRAQKAAILFIELGAQSTKNIYEHLSTKELKKLRKAVASLPAYTLREANQVLDTFLRYEESKGRAVPRSASHAKNVASTASTKSAGYSAGDGISNEQIGKFLSSLLDGSN